MKYCDKVKDAIEYEKKRSAERIEEYKNCNEDAILVEKVLSGKKYQLWIDHEVNVSWWARSMQEVKDMLRDFGKEKVILRAEDGYVASDTNPVWYLQGRKTAIRLSPSWSTALEGATCRLVQVGSEKTERPIYKLICDDKEGSNG